MPITRPTLTKNAERGSRDGTSPRDTWSLDAVGSDIKRFVKWSERFDAIDYYLGHARIDLDGSGDPLELQRLTPKPHPYDARLYPTRMEGIYNHKIDDLAPYTTVEGEVMNAFEKVEYLIHYERLPYKIKEDDEITYEYERYTYIGEERVSTDYVTLPGGGLGYRRSSGSDPPHNQPIPFATGIVLPIIEFPVTWYRLPEELIDFDTPGPWLKRLIGSASAKSYLGSVNKYAFKGFQPGTLLFSNYRRIRKPMPVTLNGYDPAVEWDIEYTFAYDPNKWNFKYYWSLADATNNGWYFISKDSYYASGSIPDGASLYNERNFDDLFDVT